MRPIRGDTGPSPRKGRRIARNGKSATFLIIALTMIGKYWQDLHKYLHKQKQAAEYILEKVKRAEKKLEDNPYDLNAWSFLIHRFSDLGLHYVLSVPKMA
ncbi:unnamed protein product [Staurois parvus]|uniref:Uncharacterized protein n=1 Tax=Staurois parvus TaxID=386267 RepID=A0ABN9GTY6_9NEOB|nr:unnamed protein product [Staurois parvus]